MSGNNRKEHDEFSEDAMLDSLLIGDHLVSDRDLASGDDMGRDAEEDRVPASDEATDGDGAGDQDDGDIAADEEASSDGGAGDVPAAAEGRRSGEREAKGREAEGITEGSDAKGALSGDDDSDPSEDDPAKAPPYEKASSDAASSDTEAEDEDEIPKPDSVITLRFNRKVMGPLLAALSGILFILYFSSWTSPLLKGSYGYDSAFFSMAGRAIVNGKVMYRDYFDIKGPVFFFWEALGQFLHTDRIGINILQFICIIAAALYLYRICEMYRLSGWQKFFVFLSVYFVYATTLWGGNSVEEYCLPLNFACLYYGIRYLKGIKREADTAFFFGLCFAVMALSKVTVAAPMCAVILVVLLDLIYRRQFLELVRCILFFLGGAAIVVAPVIVYYYTRGALWDMVNCVFTVAFARGTDYYEGFSVKEIANMTGKSETSVQTQLYRARKLLKAALGEEFSL